MGREQRWAASGVVLLLGALWGTLGVGAIVEVYAAPQGDDMTGLAVFAVGVLLLASAAVWVAAGLLAVRRRAAGRWPWWPIATLSLLAAGGSALVGGLLWSPYEPVLPLLFGFQAVAMLAWTVLLWVPPPRPGPGAGP